MGHILGNLTSRLQSVQNWHTEIQNYDVRAEANRPFDGNGPVISLSTDLPLRTYLDQRTQ